MKRGRSPAGTARPAQTPGAKELLAALDRLPVAFALFDGKRRLAAWNAPLAALGLFPKSLLKQGVPLAQFQRHDAGLKRKAAGAHEISLATGKVYQGSRRRVPPGQLLLTYEDVTEARLAAQRYDTASRAVNEGVYDWDIAGGRTYYSERVLNAVGFTQQQLRTAADWLKRFHPEDRPRFEAALVAHFKGQTERFECDYRFRAKDGSWRWARQHGIAIRDARGRAVRMIGSTGDINELKRVEQALKESQERLALATQAATEGIYEWDVATGSLYLSDRAKSYFAVKGRKLTPAAWNALLHKEDFAGYRAAIASFFSSPHAQFEHEYRLRKVGGGLSWILDRAVAVRDAKGRVTRMVGAVADITQRKLAELELRRARDEATEALERQTATAEILSVIAGTPSDVRPVLDAIVKRAAKLCEAQHAVFYRLHADGYRPEAAHNVGKEYLAYRNLHPIKVSSKQVMGRIALARKPVHVLDVLADPHYKGAAAQKLAEYRTVLGVPVIRDGKLLGNLAVFRTEVRAFSKQQTALLQTFADQAVIAIENVRLFNETKEALERQTATAEILKVIASSPSDVQPVLDAIVASAERLFLGRRAVLRILEEGNLVRRAGRDLSDDIDRFKVVPLDRDSVVGQAVLDCRVTEVADTLAADASLFAQRNRGKISYRAMCVAPLLRDGKGIGVISVLSPEPGAMPEKQKQLLQTFADQAVIAIENVRLFNETRESLERQTATAEILKVIASSPSDVQPVFDAIAASARRLLDGGAALVARRDGDLLQLAAYTSTNEAADAALEKLWPAPITGKGHMGTAVLSASPVLVDDIQNDSSYSEAFRESARTRGLRSVVSVPMLREGEAIGVISVNRSVAGRFSEHQTNLLKTFADQAVIAIENVRLFKELQSRTEALTRSVGQLTALGEVGQAISSSLDLETVLQTIVSRAVQLTGVDAGSIYEYDEREEVYRLQAAEKMAPELVEAVRKSPIRKGDGATGRTAETLEPVQVPDILDDSYHGSRKDNLTRTGYRAVLAVPLLRENHLLGALQVFRKTPGAFAPEIVELLKTFATQSAMAIQNARLFREIAEKGRQLEQASQHKSNFLASMSHELRTPLNAILGFNEMILGQVYGEVPSDMQEPLTDIQTSGKHLLRLINNVLDLAKIEAGRMELSLQDYSVHDTVGSVHSTLRPLAADKGLEFLATVPEDLPLAYGDGGRIAQCLMNLAGNSIKFTKAGKVEIAVEEKDGLLTYRVSDTGIGIPPDKIESLFTEFKQTDATIASEYGGTGLGLSISKKFVEMHGGRIWIESELGKGSVFIIEVPLRVNAP